MNILALPARRAGPQVSSRKMSPGLGTISRFTWSIPVNLKPLSQSAIADKPDIRVSVSTHSIALIIIAHSILKSLGGDLCASFKQTASANAMPFPPRSWNGQKLSSFLQPSCGNVKSERTLPVRGQKRPADKHQVRRRGFSSHIKKKFSPFV